MKVMKSLGCRRTSVLPLICMCLFLGSGLTRAIADNLSSAKDLVRMALDGPMTGAEEIVFAVRSMGRDGHWYANFGHRSTGWDQMQYGPDGGKLCRLNLRTGDVSVLLEDSRGSIRDPQLHYDGQKILFSYREGES